MENQRTYGPKEIKDFIDAYTSLTRREERFKDPFRKSIQDTKKLLEAIITYRNLPENIRALFPHYNNDFLLKLQSDAKSALKRSLEEVKMQENQRTKKALFYLHDFKCKDILVYTFRNRGCDTEEAENIDDMLKKLEKTKYDWCLVDDANLKKLESLDLSNTQRVYDKLKERVGEGEMKFLLLSYFQEVLDKAKEQNLPAMEKREFDARVDEFIGKKCY